MNKYVATLLFQFCAVLKSKDMSDVLHNVVRYTICVRCIVNGEDNISYEMSRERSERHKKMIIIRFVNISTNNSGGMEHGNKVTEEKEKHFVQTMMREKSTIKMVIFSGNVYATVRSIRRQQ